MSQPGEFVTHEYLIGGSAPAHVWERLEKLLLVQEGVTIIRDFEDITPPPQLVSHQDFRDAAPNIGARPQDGTRNWTALVRAYDIQHGTQTEPRREHAPATEFPLKFVLSPEAALEEGARLTVNNARLPLGVLDGYVTLFDEFAAGSGEKAALQHFCPKGANMGSGVIDFCRKFVTYKLAEISPPDA